MDVYEAATGDCIVCGESAEGSLYWTEMPRSIWEKIRPHVAHFFPDEDHVQNIFFVPPYTKPFCGPVCVGKWHEEHGSYGQGEI